MANQVVTRVDKRICRANEVASHETANFERLTIFAETHPVIFVNIFREFLRRPDSRFGDTLLVFCDGVKHGRYLQNKPWKDFNEGQTTC